MGAMLAVDAEARVASGQGGSRAPVVPLTLAAGRRPLSNGEDLALLRDQEARALMAMRKAQDRMAAGQRDLERRLKAFEKELQQAELRIEAQWRREHWGREPDRPPAWRHADGPVTERCRRPSTKPLRGRAAG